MAAETKRKSGADASAYLKAKTEEWQTLAKTPGYEHLDSRLCMGDLRSNEIYYHLKCWMKLKRDFASDNASSSKGEAVSDNLKFKRNFCLRKMYHDVYDSLHENPSQLIELREGFKKFELYSDNHLDKHHPIQG